MESVVVIEIPWSRLRDLSQNNGNPIWKTGVIKRLRAFAWKQAKACEDRWPANVREVAYRLWVPDNVQRDTVNILQNCKPAVDGCVDAGLVKNDCWQVLRLGGVEVAIDRDRPRVEMIFKGDERNANQVQSVKASKGVGTGKRRGASTKSEGGSSKRATRGGRKRGPTLRDGS
jgi:hypothetical protein